MQSGLKYKILGAIALVLIIFGVFMYFKYFFTYEQRQQIKRSIGSVTGQNLTVTVFSMDGKIVKRWVGVEKISTGRTKDSSGERNYTYFFTREGKYVQIPDSVWYIAEEE